MARRYLKLIQFLLFSGLWGGIFGNKCRNEPSCRVTRVHGMKSADCYKLDLHHFPKCLTADAEVIDLTYNRIREIAVNDLKKYKNLKFLYLAENMITKIDPDAFIDKTELQTLDLAYNAFSKTIPEVIFHLPSLKNLYLSQNQNINIVEILENAVPITSPLVKLDISYNNYDDQLQRLPKLGIISSLLVYNVSGMDLYLSMSDTAGLCNLKFFINDNVTAYFDDPCDCWNIDRWFRERKIQHTRLECKIEPTECSFSLSDEDEEMFSSCAQQHAEMVYQGKLNKTLMISGGVILVLILLILLVLWKWRRMRVKKRVIKKSIIRHQFNPCDEI